MSFGGISRSGGGLKRSSAPERGHDEKLSETQAKSPKLLPSNYTKVSAREGLNAGDHIAVYRRGNWSPVGYYHHAIYMGDDEVIEFNDKGVERRSFADFKDGCYVYRIEYNSLQCYLPETVCQNAMNSLITGYGQYHMVQRNCQHFATEMKTGTAWSDQAIRAVVLTGGLALLP